MIDLSITWSLRFYHTGTPPHYPSQISLLRPRRRYHPNCPEAPPLHPHHHPRHQDPDHHHRRHHHHLHPRHYPLHLSHRRHWNPLVRQPEIKKKMPEDSIFIHIQLLSLLVCMSDHNSGTP